MPLKIILQNLTQTRRFFTHPTAIFAVFADFRVILSTDSRLLESAMAA